MMDKLQKVLMMLLLAVVSLGLSGCDGEVAFSGGGIPEEDPTGSANVASVLLLASSLSMGTSSTSEVTLTAQVKDLYNNLMEGESVIFTASGGALAVQSATTNASGIATATLSPAGDPSNRTITVYAGAGSGGVFDSVNVAVSGTRVSISGETAVVLNDTVDLTVSLSDSKGVGIPGELLTVSSASGNPIAATSLSTDSSGNVSITLTGSVAGTDTITVTALGGTASQTHSVGVSGDEFTVTLPATDLAIGSPHTVTATWKKNNVAVANGTVINFSSTRGSLSAPSATTTTGVATVTVSSTTAGPVSVTASSTGGPTASVVGEFVATTPATLNAQAEVDVMGPDGQQNTITAVVRDLAGNFVKNIPIRFSILQDTSGGSISNATAVTDSLGRATTVYTSTAATTATDGVVIRAEVEATPALNESIFITVGQSELFVRLGTNSSKLVSLDETRYSKTYNVLVTDSGGNASPNTNVTLTLIPTTFYKGTRVPSVDNTDPLNPKLVGPVLANKTATCLNEDSLVPATAFNGVLDAGEDLNMNGTLEPGNVASVTGTVQTDATGFALIDVIYAKDYASWTRVKLRASAQVAGSEGSDEVEFSLPVLLADIEDPETAHPGDVSPFGSDLDYSNVPPDIFPTVKADCTDPL